MTAAGVDMGPITCTVLEALEFCCTVPNCRPYSTVPNYRQRLGNSIFIMPCQDLIIRGSCYH